MEKVFNFFLLLLSQFAGGPGPAENNLVRFGLPAILWAVLLYIAWSRQKTQDLPREKLLVWGFGLALVRELYMFGQMAYRLLGSGNVETGCDVIQPLEHGLAMAAMIVVAGAFLHYMLEDHQIARRYLQIGLGITILVFILTSWAWPRQLAAYPQIKFHQTWAAWLFHVPLSILMGAAVFLLWRKPGWLRNVVATALTFYLISELLLLLNYATARAYNNVICPIGNSFHILAIPLLGYVYLREQSIEKKRAEEALIAYRDHLEELVTARTAELTSVNTQLKQEVFDRTRAEEALERLTHRYELILESAGEGICGINPDGQIVFANPAAARMLGYASAELLHRPCHSIWHANHTNDSPHPLEECPIYLGYSQGIQRYGDDEYFWRRDGSGFPVRYFSSPVREKGELAGTVVVFQDITERKRHEAEIAQRNASLATQNAVAATLSQSLEIEENLKNVLEMVRLEAGMEIGLIYLSDPESDQLSLHHSSGLQPMQDIQVLQADDCACQQISRQALLHKRTITANPRDISNARGTHCMDQGSIRSLISVPLVSKGRVVGALTLASSQPGRTQANKLELLTAIGQQIGMAIENARLFKDAESWAAELSRLHEASSYLTATFDLQQVYTEIARQSAWLLKCQKACVFQLNGQDAPFEFKAGFGLAPFEKQILEEQLPEWGLLTGLAGQGKTTVIQDASRDGHLPGVLKEELHIQAVMFVPVWSSERPQAFVLLLETRSPRPWNNRKVELVEGLANRAAVALMNASLHQQLELAAALEERQRIAANMHDGLAQTLSLLGLRVDRMQELLEDERNAEVERVTGEIRAVVNQASTEVRRSIASLQARPQVRSSLQKLLQDLVKQLESPDGPRLSFEGGVSRAIKIPSEQTEQILPLVQEAILNARRHARAQAITVRLEKAEEKIQITIEDDGCGFELNAPTGGGDHFGLSIMQARAARIGGELRIDSSPGNGTSILLAWQPAPENVSKTNTPYPNVRPEMRS